MRTLLVLFISIFITSSCGSLKSAGKTAAASIIDCTKHETAKVVGELRPLMGATIAHAVDTAGKIDYGTVRDFAKGFVTDVSRCAVADAVARLMNPPAEGADAPKLTPLQVDRDAARAGFHELFGGQKFRTEAGEI